jgi:hypothetical protein
MDIIGFQRRKYSNVALGTSVMVKDVGNIVCNVSKKEMEIQGSAN